MENELEYGQMVYSLSIPRDYMVSNNIEDVTNPPLEKGTDTTGSWEKIEKKVICTLPVRNGYNIIKIGIQAEPKTQFSINGMSMIMGRSGIYELDAGIPISGKIEFEPKPVISGIDPDWNNYDTAKLNAFTNTLKNNLNVLQGQAGSFNKNYDYNDKLEDIIDSEGEDKLPDNYDIWDEIYDTHQRFLEKFNNEYLAYKRHNFGKYIVNTVTPTNIIIDYVMQKKTEGSDT